MGCQNPISNLIIHYTLEGSLTGADTSQQQTLETLARADTACGLHVGRNQAQIGPCFDPDLTLICP